MRLVPGKIFTVVGNGVPRAHQRDIGAAGKFQMLRRFGKTKYFVKSALEGTHTCAAAADQVAVNVEEYKSNRVLRKIGAIASERKADLEDLEVVAAGGRVERVWGISSEGREAGEEGKGEDKSGEG